MHLILNIGASIAAGGFILLFVGVVAFAASQVLHSIRGSPAGENLEGHSVTVLAFGLICLIAGGLMLTVDRFDKLVSFIS